MMDEDRRADDDETLREAETPRRFFTVDQARQLLPKVREIVGEATLLSSRLPAFSEELQQLAAASSSNSGSPAGTEFLYIIVRLQGRLRRLEEMGVVVKGVQEGLVDFPHLHDGREVYLCWKYGEEDIEYWHEVDAGFAGRTPLDEL